MNYQSSTPNKRWKLNYFPPYGGKFSAILFFNQKNLRVTFNDKKAKKDIYIIKEEISSIIETETMVNRSVTISIRGKAHRFNSYFMDTKKFISELKTTFQNT